MKNTWVNKNCKYDVSSKRGNSNTKSATFLANFVHLKEHDVNYKRKQMWMSDVLNNQVFNIPGMLYRDDLTHSVSSDSQ